MFDLPPDAVGSEETERIKKRQTMAMRDRNTRKRGVLLYYSQKECKALILLWTMSYTTNIAFSWKVRVPDRLCHIYMPYGGYCVSFKKQIIHEDDTIFCGALPHTLEQVDAQISGMEAVSPVEGR